MAEPTPRQLATDIVRRLHDAGFSAFWVGGCVRDYFLGRNPGDYDVATDAKPDDIEKLFPRTIPVGRKFGVILVVEAEHQFEVATFRAEADYRDGRRPETVSFANAQADASRRDFTVNGLFFDPVAEKLHDWVGGEADLRAKIIRTIGTPEERFGEDHLRMLRAVRLASQLGFQIDPKTFAAVQSLAPKIKVISAERIRDELIKLFSPPNAGRGLQLLRESGLLEHVLPEIAATIGCEQTPTHHPEGDVFAHLCLMLSHLPADAAPSLPWAVLMHDVAKPLTKSLDPKTGSIHFYEHEKVGGDLAEQIMERLRFPRKQIDEVATAVRHHMQYRESPKMRKATLRRVMMRPTFPLELALHRLDCLGAHKKLDVYDFLVQKSAELSQQPEIHPPLLNGADMIGLGIQPGPEMGRLLAELREKQLADEISTPEQAREWVKTEMARGS